MVGGGDCGVSSECGGGGGECGGGGGRRDACCAPAPPRAVRAPPRCYKCKAALAQCVVRQGETICGQCVAVCTELRFRAAIGRNVMLRDGASVAAAASGGACSRAMLRLLRGAQQTEGVEHAVKGKTRFRLAVIHVNETEAWAESSAGKSGCAGYALARAAAVRAVDAVRSAATAEGIAPECVRVVAIESAYGGDANALHAALRGAAAADDTARDDLLRMLRQDVLLRAAAEMGCGALALGDSADLAAVRTLAAVVCGNAGGALPAEQQHRFAWPADESTMPGVRPRSAQDAHATRPQLLRPLLDTSSKELALMCHYEGLCTGGGVPPPRAFGAGALPPAPGASLNALVSDFVAAASAQTPSTVHSVLRIVGRLRPFGHPPVKGKKLMTELAGEGARQRPANSPSPPPSPPPPLAPLPARACTFAHALAPSAVLILTIG